MSITITGVRGRLGAALVRHFRRSGQAVLPLERANCDLSEPNELQATLSALQPRALIHCAAITSLEFCEENPELAHRVNAEAPLVLAQYAADHGLPMIHVSTDYVFDGRLPGLRDESMLTDPINVYGCSKLAGEQAVLSTHPQAWVARVSWLYGPDKPSFVEAMLEREARGEPLAAIADKVSTPSYTADLAKAFETLLSCQGGGPIHACNRGSTTWHGYAEEIFRILNRKDVAIKPLALQDMEAFVAERPVNTAMDPSRLEALIGHPMRPWQEALEDYLNNALPQRYFSKA